jgi:hypothetical protein
MGKYIKEDMTNLTSAQENVMNKRMTALLCACLIIVILAFAFSSIFTRPIFIVD